MQRQGRSGFSRTRVNTIYQFIKPFLDNKMSIFEEFVAFKVLNKIEADDILIILNYFTEKIRLEISCESSASQMMHMKCPVLFSSKKKKIYQNFICCCCD